MIAYLGDGCCKDNNFIKLADSLHELINAWPLDDIDIVVVALNLYRDRKVGLMEDLITGSAGAVLLPVQCQTHLK